jgi:PAS domain S-box-containing protein
MINQINALHVDDEQPICELTAEFLEQQDERFDVFWTTDPEQGLDILSAQHIDCVVSDYDMPGMSGIEFLDSVHETMSNVPFIMFTGRNSEEVIKESVSAGATDYLQKQTGPEQYSLLRDWIEELVCCRRFQEETKALQKTVDMSEDAMYFTDADGVIKYSNRRFEDLMGYSTGKLVGQTSELSQLSKHDGQFFEEFWETVRSGETWEGTIVHEGGGGESLAVDQTIMPVVNEVGDIYRLVVVAHEVSKQRKPMV